jgi:hypothetical protein
MDVDRNLNCRKAKHLTETGKVDINPEDIKAGMLVVMYEPDGTIVTENGVTTFIATSDAKIDEHGVVGFEYEVAPLGKTNARFLLETDEKTKNIKRGRI